MSESIAVTRARIACRIYLALYDAGHEGLIFATGATFVSGVPMREDPELTREVIQRLRDVGAIQERDSSNRAVAMLNPDLRSRMEQTIPYPLTITERLRRDLVAVDQGEALVVDDFLGLESMIRTGATHTKGL